MQDFNNLTIYQDSYNLVLKIYKLTERFPKAEQFNITSQLRRSSLSVTLNIAEGASRGGDKEFSRFLQISLGSLAELLVIVQLSTELKFINTIEQEELIQSYVKLRKMIISLRTKLLNNF